MVAIGYADNRPVDTNATLDGRSRNRRVNVLILNEVGGVASEITLQDDGQISQSAGGLSATRR
jgi:chemotaxis protein MotB